MRRFLFIIAMGWIGCGAGLAQERGALTIEVLSGTSVTPERVEVYGRSHALVIGIDAYTHPAWPRLRNAVADARTVAAALERHGFQVTPLINPKSAELEAALRSFFITVGADPKARLVVWFAGHGHTLTTHGSDEGFLVPADAPSPADELAFRSGALAMDLFRYFFRQARSKHVLAVFDSCFSGTVLDITREADLRLPPDIAALAGGTARQLIASGDRGQKVSDDGTFRRLFVDAISGEVPVLGRDGYLTAQELGGYLRREMTQLSVRKANPQHPQTGYLNAAGMNRGDMVFEVVRADGSRPARGPVNRGKDAAAVPPGLAAVASTAAIVPPAAPAAPVLPPEEIARRQRIAEEFKGALATGKSPSIDAFLAKYPDASEAPDARAAYRDFQRFEAAERVNTVDAYRGYLGTPPQGRRQDEAERRISALLSAEREKLCQAFAADAVGARNKMAGLGCEPKGDHWDSSSNFLRSHCLALTPEKRSAEAAKRGSELAICELAVKERAAWTEALKSNTPEGYRRFMADWPQSASVAEAKTKLDGLEVAAWAAAEKANTEVEYRTFAERFPDGRYARDVEGRITALAEAARKRDDDVYAAAKTSDTSVAYDKYLAEFCKPVAGAAPKAQKQSAAKGKQVSAGVPPPAALCRHEAEARAQLVGLKEFEAVKGKGDRKALDDYLKKFGQSRFAVAATAEIAAIDESALQKTCAAYTKTAVEAVATLASEKQRAIVPCGDHPGERWAVAPEMHTAFCRKTGIGEPERVAEIKARTDAIELCSRPRRDDEAWAAAEAASTIRSIARYRQRWPQGRHTAAASGKLVQLCEAGWAPAKSAATWVRLRVYSAGDCSGGARQAEAAGSLNALDDREWGKVTTAGRTRAAYAAYINATGGSASKPSDGRQGGLFITIGSTDDGEGKRAAEASAAIADFDTCDSVRKSDDLDEVNRFLEGNSKSRCFTEIRGRLPGLKAKLAERQKEAQYKSAQFVFTRERVQPLAAAASGAAKRIAVAYADGNLALFDAANGRLVTKSQAFGKDDGVGSMLKSADERWLILTLTRDNQLERTHETRIYDFQSGQLRQSFPRTGATGLSEDGRLLGLRPAAQDREDYDWNLERNQRATKAESQRGSERNRVPLPARQTRAVELSAQVSEQDKVILTSGDATDSEAVKYELPAEIYMLKGGDTITISSSNQYTGPEQLHTHVRLILGEADAMGDIVLCRIWDGRGSRRVRASRSPPTSRPPATKPAGSIS